MSEEKPVMHYSEILGAVENRSLIWPQSHNFRIFGIALLSLTKEIFRHNWKMINNSLPFILLNMELIKKISINVLFIGIRANRSNSIYAYIGIRNFQPDCILLC